MSGFKKFREEQNALRAHEQLLDKSKKKIITTMIGALADLESMLAYELGANPELHEKLRSSILDRGNNQIRNLEIDFGAYEIQLKKYVFMLPVTPKDK